MTLLAVAILCCLIAWHFVVDWKFQGEEEAKAKAVSIKACFLHVLIYTLAFAPVAALLLFYALDWSAASILTFVAVNSGLHLLIDNGIYVWNKWAWENDPKRKYLLPIVVLDEIFHIGVLLVTFLSLQR